MQNYKKSSRFLRKVTFFVNYLLVFGEYMYQYASFFVYLHRQTVRPIILVKPMTGHIDRRYYALIDNSWTRNSKPQVKRSRSDAYV